MATIDPNQTFDIIHTLTFAEASGNCPIRLHRGSSSAISGTVYYRAGTSGDWISLSVSGTSTTFPVTDTTVQVAHDWNKSGNNYMTPSFRDATNITSIAISQKSPLTGTMGNNFMQYYARECSSLTSLDVPDTSGLTSVGNYFMQYYAYRCSSLTSLAVPDTSSLTSVGSSFMVSYAYGCSSLTELVLPAVGWFEDNNANWYVPSDRLGVLKGRVLNSDDLNGWKALTASGKTLHTNYIRDPELVYCEEAPEYCEYVADLIRTIIQSQSYNADTERITLKDYSYSADTKRKIIQRHIFTGDTARATIKEYTFTADTFRKVLKEYQYPTDARRIIIRTDAHNADLLRRIVKQYEYAADTMRFVVELGVYVGDTYRVVRAEQVYSADALRQAIKEYEFIADTLRRIVRPYIRLKVTLSIQEREIGLGIQEREVKLEVEQMPLIGNTVRLKAEFKDFNGEYVSPENVILRIYDGYKKQIGEDIPVSPSAVGKYQYDYVIPGDVIGPLYIEFVGTIGELPILGRATIDKRWI